MDNSLQEKRHQQEDGSSCKQIESGKQITLQKLVSFSVCLSCFTIIEDSCYNGLTVYLTADDSKNRCQKVRFHELTDLFRFYNVERKIFPDYLLDMRYFRSHFKDLWAIQNFTEISFIPCLYSHC